MVIKRGRMDTKTIFFSQALKMCGMYQLGLNNNMHIMDDLIMVFLC